MATLETTFAGLKLRNPIIVIRNYLRPAQVPLC